jgi:ornithine decarboxylase
MAILFDQKAEILPKKKRSAPAPASSRARRIFGAERRLFVCVLHSAAPLFGASGACGELPAAGGALSRAPSPSFSLLITAPFCSNVPSETGRVSSMNQNATREASPENLAQLRMIAETYGTPVLVMDHEKIRHNYLEFRSALPRVQAYYAVKANSSPEIVHTLYKIGASFDVASFPEFLIVYENIKDMPEKERQDFIWDKIIYANTIKLEETLRELNPYKPLVTFDNLAELRKIKSHCPLAGVVLRIRVPNTGSMVELSSKFGADPGEAVDLIQESLALGLTVEGISFHVGSQCNNFENFMQALQICSGIFRESESRGHQIKLLDIGGGFPVRYHAKVQSFRTLARKLNAEINRLFPKDVEVMAEPGRFMVANAGTLVVKVIGKAVRDGKTCYYIDDGIYHTFSGILFDHCTYPIRAFEEGETKVSAVFGPTCDALDTISVAEELPELELGDFLYAENIGAYSLASSTNFNGFPPAKIVHINQEELSVRRRQPAQASARPRYEAQTAVLC